MASKQSIYKVSYFNLHTISFMGPRRSAISLDVMIIAIGYPFPIENISL